VALLVRSCMYVRSQMLLIELNDILMQHLNSRMQLEGYHCS